MNLFQFWFKPREAVRCLNQRTRAQWCLIVALIIIFFLQAAVFVLSIDKAKIAPLFSLKGAVLAIMFLLFLAVAVFVVMFAGTWAFWLAAKCFKGQGTFSQTRPAVIWTLFSSIPIGFFWMILYAAYQNQELLGKAAGIIAMLSYIGGIATLIYMFIVLLKTISETNKVSLGISFFTIALGILILGATALVLLPRLCIFLDRLPRPICSLTFGPWLN